MRILCIFGHKWVPVSWGEPPASGHTAEASFSVRECVRCEKQQQRMWVPTRFNYFRGVVEYGWRWI